ncbi:MAG: Rieske (2Fe-2S) protein [Acidimicrobiia bacterium]
MRLTEEHPPGEGGSEPEWVAVAVVDALPPGAVVASLVGPSTEVAVFNVDGELCALEGTCPHRGGRLADGMVRDGVVTCPRHWWRFDLHTGQHTGDPGLRLTRYPVRVVEGTVEVLLPPAPPALSLRERLLAAGRDWKAAGGGGG